MNVIIYHGSCCDGFTAAWLIYRWLTDQLGVDESQIELIPARYEEAPPYIAPGSKVWIVDFSYEPDQLQAIGLVADSLVVLDHHETSRQWMLDAFGDQVVTDIETLMDGGYFDTDDHRGDLFVSDMDHSGAGLAAIYRYGSVEMAPDFIAAVQDRDLWHFNLIDTPEVFAAVSARPYTIEAYDALAKMTAAQLVSEGRGIAMYRQRLIEQTLETAFQTTVLGHDDIWVAASPYAIGSDVAGELAKRDPSRFAGYFVTYEDHLKWGLRSAPEGMNVAELAQTVGGGGHAHAAGFEVGDGSPETMSKLLASLASKGAGT